MADILPPPEKTRRSSVSLPDEMWTRLDEIAEKTSYTRDTVIQHFLRWAIQEWEAEREGKKSRR